VTPLPTHIVSINLCADQYLLALADRGQIAAVTVYARDPGMSAAAGAAAGIPATRATAEELLVLAPRLLLAAPYQVAAKAKLLPDTRIVAVPEANDEPAIEENIRTVAAAVGHADRGDRLIASIRAQLPPVIPGRGPIVAQYQRGGYLTGTGTLVDDLMRRAGLTNLATVLHRPPLSRLSLEAIIAAKPDYLLLETRDGIAGDRGAALLDHPALARAFPAARRLTIDGAWTVCGGPAYPKAVAALRAQVAPVP
jgi:iron complex transport system substrate-binding protein